MRTMIEAMAATQGHTQSLHTNAFDEALALPTDHSARIARNTQLILQKESGTTRFIDPWGGSAYVERLTHDLAARAMSHIEEVETLGGMAAAIEKGIPKLRIEEAAARTQARIDSGQQALVGVNACRPEQDIGGRRAEDRQCRGAGAATVQAAGAQGHARRGCRRERPRCADQCGAQATAICSNSPSAPRARNATVGEISLALEKVFGRHVATVQTISGVYRKEIGENAAVDDVQEKVEAFEQKTGAKPRILVAKMGQDGHDRGQKVIATAFADLGFDVTVGAMFQTPEEIAKLATEHDGQHRRRLVARRRPSDAGPGTARGARQARRQGHHDRRRRRHPAAGLRGGAQGRRRRDLPARHGHSGSGGAPDGAVAGTMSFTPFSPVL